MYYFDNSATTRPMEEVVKVYSEVAGRYFANPSSAHALGEEAKALLTSARAQIAGILGYEREEIFFTSSGTEANNWVLQAIVEELHRIHPKRNRILLSAIEHPASLNQIPLLQDRGYKVDLIPVDQDGMIMTDQLENLLSSDVLLISTMAVNNEVGSVQPLEILSQLLASHPQVAWHVDGVQATTTQMPLLMNKRIDMLTLSSHKFHAVRGVGILAKRKRIAARPFLYGGGQEGGYRSSTENLAAIVATAKALRWVNEQQQATKKKLSSYRQALISHAAAYQWQIFAQESASEHILCMALAPVPGEVLLHAFEAENVFLSTTSACSSRSHKEHATLRAMGIADKLSGSAIRISMTHTTTAEEVDYLKQTITKVSKQFEHYND